MSGFVFAKVINNSQMHVHVYVQDQGEDTDTDERNELIHFKPKYDLQAYKQKTTYKIIRKKRIRFASYSFFNDLKNNSFFSFKLN